MTYRLSISDASGRSFEHEVSADGALSVILALSQASEGGVAESELENEVLPTPTLPKQPAVTFEKKGQRLCSFCLKPGHQARKCPRADRTPSKKSKEGEGRFSGHECCGSRGSKHLLACPLNRKAGTSANARLVADRKTAFSNGTWSNVKNALDGGDTIDIVVREKGLDENEVRRVNLSDTYDEYLLIA